MEIGTIGLISSAKAQEFADIGGTRSIVSLPWETLQPQEGGSLSVSAVQAIRDQIAIARTAHLDVICEIALQYPPSWAKSLIPTFKNQFGDEFTTPDIGADVRDWIWSQTGRKAVDDYVSRCLTILRDDFPWITTMRIGGGYFGEWHYPYVKHNGIDVNWWSFGEAAQTGEDLAPNQDICPLPGYIPYGEGSDPANDERWVTWHVRGFLRYLRWQISVYRLNGWRGDLHILVPGFGRRANWAVDSPQYQEASASGEVYEWLVDMIANLWRVWLHSTWVDQAIITPTPQLDSDYTAWQKLLTLTRQVHKSGKLTGENTFNAGGEGMSRFFGADGAAQAGYAGLDWIDYAALEANEGQLLALLRQYLGEQRS